MHTIFVHDSAPTTACLETLSGERDARALSLDAPFDEVGLAGSCAEVSLAPLANRIETRELRRFLHRASYLLREGGRVRFLTRDPDDYPDDAWPGEVLEVAGTPERFRPLRHTLEILRLFPLRVLTPVALEASEEDGLPPGRHLQWTAVRVSEPTKGAPDASLEDRYAPRTAYRRFDRLEEPETADDLFYAASRLRPGPGERVLALGVNDGRELEMFTPEVRDAVELWGIDHSPEAIEASRRRHPLHAERMLVADLNELATLELPPIHCVLLLNILQCTNVDRDRLLRELLPRLTPDARLLASIPNCHFGAHDILRRPLRRDDPRHDRSLVVKDARFLTRALYRDGFRTVETFGTLDLFLLARR